MSIVVQWLVTRLLAWALRRWPEPMREDLSREWTAELHALGQEDGVAAPVRAWRQLRFAASLATSRPHRTSIRQLGWLRRRSPVLVQTAWQLSAPALTAAAVMAARTLLLVIPLPFSKTVLLATFAAESLAAQTVFAVWVGTLLGRRFVHRVGYVVGPAGYVWVTLPLIGGLLLVDVLARASGQMWAGSWLTAAAIVCLAVLLPVAAAGTAAVARGRPRLGIIVAAFAAPVLTVATVYVMVLLAPRPLSAGGPWWWLDYISRQPLLSLSYTSDFTATPIEAALAILPSLILTTTILALAQAIRLARSSAGPLPAASLTPPAVAPPTGQPNWIPAAARSPWWHRSALAAGAYSVVAWAVTLAYLTPNIGVQNSFASQMAPDGQLLDSIPAGWPEWTTEEGRLWMQELQLSCIVCAALCLLFAAAYRGRPLLPALAGTAVLLAVNMAVVRGGWTTPRLLPWLVGGGLILGALAWSAATRSRPDPHRRDRPRRLVITITVLAAILIPGSFMARAYISPGLQAPPILLAVAVGLPTIWTLFAVLGVRATSARRRTTPSWRLPAGLATLIAVGGTLYYQDSLIRYDPEGGTPFLMLIGPPALALPVAVWTITAIRARPASPTGLATRAILTTLLLVAGWQLTIATIMISGILARLVLFPMEYANTGDGLPLVPGTVALGLLLGAITGHRLTRPDPTPVADPVLDLGQPPPPGPV